ncbi:MAG: CpXC domain-containing protein [Solobacterium sp.]|nr:CpXC domain-containing protein [Solobacterium sp.]
MMEIKDIEYTCPYCGKTFETRLYEAVNASEDVDLAELSRSGDIFKHLCPHCHTDFMIQNHFVYHDPSRKFMIVLSNEDVPYAMREYAKPMVEKGYRLRHCKTVRDFTEKVQIFEDGIDDVLVELAKYDSFIEFIDNRKGNAEEVTSIEYQSTKDDVMKINVRTDDKGLSFLIPVAGLEEVVSSQQDRFQLDEASFPCVDSAWIISLYLEDQQEEMLH